MAVEWREVVGWDQDEIEEMRAIAYAYLRQGHLALARTFYEALVVLDPNSLYDLRTLAVLRDLQGDTDGALTLYGKVLQLEPTDPFASLGLAKAQLAAGRRGEAIPRLQKLSTIPDRRVAADAQALLQAYS
jgi:Flp pilus assembly protein TadD